VQRSLLPDRWNFALVSIIILKTCTQRKISSLLKSYNDSKQIELSLFIVVLATILTGAALDKTSSASFEVLTGRANPILALNAQFTDASGWRWDREQIAKSFETFFAGQTKKECDRCCRDASCRSE
jgi:hypothetical protein